MARQASRAFRKDRRPLGPRQCQLRDMASRRVELGARPQPRNRDDGLGGVGQGGQGRSEQAQAQTGGAMVGIRLVSHRADCRRKRSKSQDWPRRGYGQRPSRVPSLFVFAHRRLALNRQGLPETRHIPRRSVHGQKTPKGQHRRGHDSPLLITTRLNPSKTGLPTCLLRNKNPIQSRGSQQSEESCFENYASPVLKTTRHPRNFWSLPIF